MQNVVPEHDPVAFATGLSRKLATTSRNICMFLGAGASRACGLPDVAGLQQIVLDGLDGPDRGYLQGLLHQRNLEQVLSRLRRIAALIDDLQSIDGLTGPQASELDARICRLI